MAEKSNVAPKTQQSQDGSKVPSKAKNLMMVLVYLRGLVMRLWLKSGQNVIWIIIDHHTGSAGVLVDSLDYLLLNYLATVTQAAVM